MSTTATQLASAAKTATKVTPGHMNVSHTKANSTAGGPEIAPARFKASDALECSRVWQRGQGKRPVTSNRVRSFSAQTGHGAIASPSWVGKSCRIPSNLRFMKFRVNGEHDPRRGRRSRRD